MQRIRRLATIAAGVLGFLGYVWYAAVRKAPRVKRRKSTRRVG